MTKKKLKQEEELDLSEFFMDEDEDYFADEMASQIFSMATECQKTALGLAELVLKYAKNDALDEQEIYKIYQRAFEETVKIMEKGPGK